MKRGILIDMKQKIIVLRTITVLSLLSVALSGCTGGFLSQPTQRNPDPVHVSGIELPTTALLDTQTARSGYEMMALSTSPPTSSLAIPATFAVTRPEKKITTAYSSYFITGTSNPKQAVYFEGQEIQRLGTKGTFGVLVDLKLGTNTFIFKQGDKTAKVTIERIKASTGAAPIREITQSSMIPAISAAAYAGKEFEVGCIAPSGASVSASFEGKTVVLKQTNTDIKQGLPATFAGKILLGSDYQTGITTAAGKVSYTLSFGGSTKTYKSTGQVYVAGKGGDIVVEITNYLGFVYPNTNNLSVFKETVKKGALDTVIGQDNTYYKLSSGGWIPKEMVKVVEGKAAYANKLSKVSASVKSKSETYTFSGTSRVFYHTKISDNTFYLTFYNTSGAPKMDVSSSKLASSASVSADENSVTYTIPLKGRVWGYDVAFSENNAVLTLKYKPKLSDASATPFEGLVIMLDPGHGGSDPGALGVAGKTGPVEADVNLAHALATKKLLTQMGAKVVMTREQDSYLSLDDRLEAIEKSKVDLFISIHHNSLGENVDANNVSGMEIYYHTGLSKAFSDKMMDTLIKNLDRKGRFVEQSYYRVTLLPYAPAILLELGYLCNPLEYEKATAPSEMEKVAQSIAAGIRQSLK